MKNLHRDERGVAYVESLIALPIMFMLFNALLLFGYLSAGQMIVQRAASAATRAAVVFLPDDPEYYDRSDSTDGKKSASKEECVKQAARSVLMASPFFLVADADIDLKIKGDKTMFRPLTVELRAKYDCTSFLASFLCTLVSGSPSFVPLSSQATLAYQEGLVEKR
jgi:hypothetical protein